jgi:hypothetical protein
MNSKHAEIRMQQRAIPALAVELYHLYGREQHQDGASVLYLDDRARRKARRALEDALKRFDKISDAFGVVGAADGGAITVGHRYRRIRNY